MTTSSFHERINDHKLSLGMIRYSSGSKDDDEYFWKLVISEHCGSKRLAQLEVSISDLTKIKQFCDRAIKCLHSDGDRLKEAA